MTDDRQLLANIKTRMPELRELLDQAHDHWNYEDMVYRFYHGSYKVYSVQGLTLRIVEVLKSLAPDIELNPQFTAIVREGTGKAFDYEHNRDWDKHTRPQLEAFFHALFMLEMTVQYGEDLDEAPTLLPSGWAALLYLYGLR